MAGTIPRAKIPSLMTAEKILPFGRKAHLFALLRPLGWQVRMPAKPELSAERLSPIVIFEGPSGQSVQVQGLRLTNEIAAGHLLKLIVGSSGWQLDDFNQKTPFVAHGTADFGIEGVAFRTRIGFYLVDDVAYQIQGVAPADRFADVAALFDIAARSFDLASAPKGSVEAWSDGSVNLAALPERTAQFRYPAAWQPTPIEGERKAALELVRTKDEVFMGLIRVKSVDKTLPEGFARQFDGALEEMKERGAQIGALQLDKTIETAPPFEAGALRAYEATSNGAPLEVWLMVTETDRLYLSVSMLSPSRDATFGEWAINRRAFQIVTETLNLAE